MIPYWLMFAVFALGAAFEQAGERRWRGALAAAFVVLALAIGLRWDVGADWPNYQRMFDYTARIDFWRAISIGDPGYQAFNWVANHSGGDIWMVNLAGAAIFAFGLVRFASVQRRPWLTLLVAIPYLVIVVAMGYTRQAVAIGVLLAGLANFIVTGRILRFAWYVVVAALFHKTAIVAFPLAAMAGPRNGLVNLLIAISVTAVLYYTFLAKDSDALIKNYVGARYSSDGAGVRVAMSLFPAAIFLAARDRFDFSDLERRLWTGFAIASIGALILLLTLSSSTAVDRLALYLIPLQLAVGAAVPGALVRQGLGVGTVIAYAFAVQFTWLNYATHARYWVPYRNILSM